MKDLHESERVNHEETMQPIINTKIFALPGEIAQLIEKSDEVTFNQHGEPIMSKKVLYNPLLHADCVGKPIEVSDAGCNAVLDGLVSELVE